MRTPIREFAKQENVGLSFIYGEARAGRLVLTKRWLSHFRRRTRMPSAGARWPRGSGTPALPF